MNTSDTTAKDRRNFERYAAEASPVRIESGEISIDAMLFDTSIGGAGLTAETVTGLAFGQQVQIVMPDEDEPLTGYIRRIRRDEDCFFINVSWNDYAHIGEKKLKTVAHFVSFKGYLFVCDLLFDDVGTTKTVRLWDGATFKVLADDLCSRSIDARRSELAADENVEKTASLYNLTISPTSDIIEQILDFEFSF